jgi:hypothetical protein
MSDATAAATSAPAVRVLPAVDAGIGLGRRAEIAAWKAALLPIFWVTAEGS